MSEGDLRGDELGRLVTEVPGPESRGLAARLRAVESRNITQVGNDGPIFWDEARGAAVRDVDGNTFVDLTAGFGVAFAGHANPAVTLAIARQSATLAHALGDVHPAAAKLRLLERLAELAPGDLGVTILGSAGAEAVEAALKTASLRTGRRGVIAFERAYHGLTLGALAVTARAHFRAPFQPQLYPGIRFAPFPGCGAGEAERERSALEHVARIMDAAERSDAPIGMVLVEPVQGRGGLVVPTAGFLRGLRDLCDGERCILAFDEIYCGLGRTGRWFACQHWDVVPDILLLGKALTGALPLSAMIGTPDVMDAWPPSDGEAIHTSTFLGNPISCAAALAQLDAIEKGDLVRRADALGEVVAERTDRLRRIRSGVRGTGLGLLRGIRVRREDESDASMLGAAGSLLRRGVLALAEGEHAEVLALTPSAVITDVQLAFALHAIEAVVGGDAVEPAPLSG
ncbi:MAG: aminotransferase class III-fold pyridoxal phosphate-dependent enzyme [Gemmatimonadota bacterium]